MPGPGAKAAAAAMAAAQMQKKKQALAQANPNNVKPRGPAGTAGPTVTKVPVTLPPPPQQTPGPPLPDAHPQPIPGAAAPAQPIPSAAVQAQLQALDKQRFAATGNLPQNIGGMGPQPHEQAAGAAPVAQPSLPVDPGAAPPAGGQSGQPGAPVGAKATAGIMAATVQKMRARQPPRGGGGDHSHKQAVPGAKDIPGAQPPGYPPGSPPPTQPPGSPPPVAPPLGGVDQGNGGLTPSGPGNQPPPGTPVFRPGGGGGGGAGQQSYGWAGTDAPDWVRRYLR